MTAAIKDGIERVVKKIEENTRLTEIGFYSVSAGLLIYACYRKRPFKRFVKAADIPDNFIAEKTLQRGIVSDVQNVSGNGTILLVNHRPPINFPLRSRKTLPVKISGVNIGNLGYGWLETIVKDKEINFIPFSNKGKNVEAQVFLIEQDQPRPIDVGKALTSIGFAKTAEPSSKADSYVKRYLRQLKYLESSAKFHHNGQWANLPEHFRWLRKKYESLWFNLLPDDKKVPALVRTIKKEDEKNKKKQKLK
ncbi:hypothetical protein PVAND_015405 [Polypedilum vanderplanki]|uniref:Uncharacterized protein n=1 Tax=Polypedilum vanderplanki TaxID=319348 RepID=A0A9J6BC29_POLVA|nr:hypothetical protein PVAND_015405 [Polypedilum vanderplanki]